VAEGGFIRHLPFFLSKLTSGRSLPAIAARPLRDTLPEIEQPKSTRKAALYAGCLLDFAYPETGEAIVRLLNKAGVEVVFPKGQSCCGAPARYSGAYEAAAKSAVENIEALLNSGAETVVSACPTCTAALKHEFRATLEATGHHEMLAQADQLAERTIDYSTLVARLVEEGRLVAKPGAGLPALSYHDSCHLKRSLHAEQPPRELLRGAGYEIQEMAEADICCGMGGSYSVKMPEISAPMLERKLVNIQAAGAPVVAMDCPGCVMQIRGGADQRGVAVEVRHTAELIVDLYEAGPNRS